VYVSGGTVAVNAASRVTIGGKFTQLAAGTLEIDRGNGDQGRLAVSGQTSIVGGTLHVKLAAGFTPKVGDTIALMDCGGLQGRFTTVTVDGFKATALYSASGVQLHLDA
jgi:hypothetical protein